MVSEAGAQEASGRAPLGRPGPSWRGDGALAKAAAPEREPGASPLDALGLTVAPYPLRILGFVIDTLVLAMAYSVVLQLVGPLLHLNFQVSQAEMLRQLQRVQPLLILFEVSYHWLWNALGWSPGKRMLGMRTVDALGRPPGLARGLLRAMWAVLSETPFFLGYLWAGWDRERRTWHDHLAGTWVVRVRRDEELEEP